MNTLSFCDRLPFKRSLCKVSAELQQYLTRLRMPPSSAFLNGIRDAEILLPTRQSFSFHRAMSEDGKNRLV